MASPDTAGPADRPSTTDRGSSPFLSWYHHALALAYSVSAAVSAESMPLGQLGLYFVGSLVGAYVVVVVLTVGWRRLVPRLL
ncbi:hypothetical protein DU500_09205 [Haloplanus rubicundus]|uniref:Uncharacterized protein n=1 Tax=Haloplanus rubicundus TaxID=1547898 RepID=A0A345ECP4_9EURY|nr:hypothetical protein [Haloplanus rubicundus]AXG06590.1 hypothetical protein DU500_09205 [Haloplanus rubicundus]AXG09966.1 hypothetical protein DU484_08955 [Haloplanus rubicundus]